ncbi:hypothetical protein NDU88_002176 [Pleurodeles waltl]|uniref:Uncharacterized protein n=1 Tax=Pleurodeles waltl TaxID=8319 RepID=A0AAV7NEP4_PLEWA|nr:hypothetical protein NDU88_002176 [Pleurodeles waltl]
MHSSPLPPQVCFRPRPLVAANTRAATASVYHRDPSVPQQDTMDPLGPPGRGVAQPGLALWHTYFTASRGHGSPCSSQGALPQPSSQTTPPESYRCSGFFSWFVVQDFDRIARWLTELFYSAAILRLGKLHLQGNV